MIQTTIVGGGIAGAYCAYQLAKNGLHPVIFDPSHPREKPCGGLVSSLSLELFPCLRQLPIGHSERDRIYIISPSGTKTCVHFRKSKVWGFSRLELDQCLLNMAIDRGAELIKERVTEIERKNRSWKVKTQKQTYLTKTLIGADGVNSIVREDIITPLDAKNKGLCFGYFVRGLEREEISISYSQYRNGFIWVIPRSRNTSLGIGCSEIKLSYGLKKELDVFVQKNFPQMEIISKWAALIPNVKRTKTFRTPLSGTNWILIGDAAGHANPRSGEGILYALLDGELAAQAIIEKKPQMFDNLWKNAFGRSFFLDINLGNWVGNRIIREFYCKCLKLESLIQFSRF